MWQINQTFELEGVLYRILSITEFNVKWIELYNDKALPVDISVLELEELLSNQTLRPVNDPYLSSLLNNGSSISPAALKRRDESFIIIESMISSDEVFYPSSRSKLADKIVQKKLATKKTIYRLLRVYWQKGQSKNALIPSFGERGGYGSIRSNVKKPGRPSVYSDSRGTVVDEDIKKIFERVINKSLLIKTPKSQSDAYVEFREHFANSYPDIGVKDYPTKRQFTYYYRQNYKIDKRLKLQTSLTNYLKDHRPLQSTSTAHVLGPGSRYEIDATIADIYLASEIDRNEIIGRPTIYFVIDVFSRMIVGLYIGYESPSYVVAMQAIVTACTNKYELCKKVGLDIDESDWPVSGLPDAILADRGELIGHQIEALASGFGVRIENAPPRRGDAKGIVERAFGTIQEKFKPYVAGVVQGARIKKHGESDYRLQAEMSVKEFTQIILKIVLHHNNYKQMLTYDPDDAMPADIRWIPRDIWNWGIKSKTGMLRAADPEVLRVGILPRKTATLSERGLKVWGVYYISSEILKSGWLVRYSGHTRSKNLEVAYDPDNADIVYLFTDNSYKNYWRCNIADRSRRFRSMTFWKVWELQRVEKTVKKDHESVEYEKLRELNKFIEDTKKGASKERSSVDIGQSDRQRIKEIKSNKSDAIHQERSLRGKVVNASQSKEKATITTLYGDEENYDYPSFVPGLFDDESDQ